MADNFLQEIDVRAEHVQTTIVAAAQCLTNVCHAAAARSGWWSRPDARAPYMTPTRLMLMVSELGEAMEADRKGLRDEHLPDRPGLEVELADLVIRAFDMAGGQGLDLAGAIASKLAYNAERADHKLEERAKPGGKSY